MKVLILNEPGKEPAVDELSCGRAELTFIREHGPIPVSKDPSLVDVIMGYGTCTPGSSLNNLMVGWRTNPHTYLIPCWLPVEKKSFRKACLWPELTIDLFDPNIRSGTLYNWLAAVAEWQQNRMHFSDNGSLENRSPMELATSLCLRRASGVLSVTYEAGAEGRFFFSDGKLISADLGHLRGAEAFYEFFCMTQQGWYMWESKTKLMSRTKPQSVSRLITSGLQRIQDANLLFEFTTDFESEIGRTDSQSALDDSAKDSFPEQKQLYALIKENVSIFQILSASPLSRPSTMSLLSKWLSLEDIKVRQPVPESRCRVLLVDDSPLICRALQTIFAEDPRIEVIGIAHDGMEALRLIGEHKPDVVTLDLQMPKMDGLTTLKHILIEDPRPVVVLSAFTKATSRSTYESFRYGAVDVISKPVKGFSTSGTSQIRELCDRVVQASNVQLQAVQYIRRRRSAEPRQAPIYSAEHQCRSRNIVIIICGEGGFPSLLKLMLAMPDSGRIPPVIVATAMPRHVVEAMVIHLKKDAPVAIEELSAPRALSPGVCHFISDEKCHRLFRDDHGIRLEGNGGEPRKDHFFDDLLTSAADSFKSDLSAILISGTGEDGIEGMLRVSESGGMAFALSPDACLKPDLPKRIISLGYVNEIKTIAELARIFDTACSSHQDLVVGLKTSDQVGTLSEKEC